MSHNPKRKVQDWQLAQRQAMPLEAKIIMSLERIKAWYDAWDGEVYVGFSGGLDSTALLHLVRTRYPDVPAVFINTRLEFPENVRFVKETPNVRIVRPKMRFQEVIKRYGWPVVSKRISTYVYEIRHYPSDSQTVRLRMTGMTAKGQYRRSYMLSHKWRFLLDAPFEISARCCDVLKKKPAIESEKQYGHPFLGIRADEGDQRKQVYQQTGCNAFEIQRPRSWPMAFWTHDDVWAYIQENGIPYSPLYDMGYKRSGCVFCAFGAHMEDEPNRFQLLMKTHPKLYAYCMDKLGMREVLDFIKVPYGEVSQPRLFPLEDESG